MWPTNTTAVAAEEFRSEDSSYLGATLDLNSFSLYKKTTDQVVCKCKATRFEIIHTKMLTFTGIAN